jgi:hypothetical protein
LILVNFLQNGQDNIPLNRALEFRFSGPLDASSVTQASVQIREGSAFGLTAMGTFRVVGSTLFFDPAIPGQCDLSDSGFKPDTQYRVTLVGHPEEFAVRHVNGRPLDHTYSFEFRTRAEDDPELFEDQVAGVGPTLTSADPAHGSPAVTVAQGNRAVLTFSENLDPCTVNSDTVLVYEHQRGDPGTFSTAPNGNASGFVPVTDSHPSPYAWGGNANDVTPPARIRATIALEQTVADTRVVVTPEFGEWPDNSLVVIDLTFGIEDLGGAPLSPTAVAFTTENRVAQPGMRVVTFEGETPIEEESTTADVDTTRSPDRAQGWLLFAGDGDNGAVLTQPSLPETPASGCSFPRQANDGFKDDFDPTANVNLDTGTTVNTCANDTDGSTAVIWEFSTFRIRSGVIVRVIGVNPAIILVQGDVVVEAGGQLIVRGDGAGGSPQGRGANGNSAQNTGTAPAAAAAGIGVAGGGSGGSAPSTGNYGNDGVAGVGSPEARLVGGHGAGEGNSSATQSSFSQGSGTSGAGGGGGHATVGFDGMGVQSGGVTFIAPARGLGGETYPLGANADKLFLPSAGSGGGGGGHFLHSSSSFDHHTGGAGGAGGGFVDLTANGDIRVFGVIDAAGSRGGNGIGPFGFAGGTGGGGGGSGGGVRLLTPQDIALTGGTITTLGGAGGLGQVAASGTKNNGGAGGIGRIALEDGDSVITGIGTALLSPSEGTEGFYRGGFDASRFKGGGLTPQVLTGLFNVGPRSPTYEVPMQDYSAGGIQDFLANIPAATTRGLNRVSITIEARGFPITAEGAPDTTSGTGYYLVGYFTDSGSAEFPNWTAGEAATWPAADIGPRPSDNVGDGLTNLDGFPFLQLRITFYLPPTVGPFDPGPILDEWTIRFTYDQ